MLGLGTGIIVRILRLDGQCHCSLVKSSVRLLPPLQQPVYPLEALLIWLAIPVRNCNEKLDVILGFDNFLLVVFYNKPTRYPILKF